MAEPWPVGSKDLSRAIAEPDLLWQARQQPAPVAWTTSTSIIAIAAGLMGIGAVMTVSAAAANTDKPILGWAFWGYPAMRQLVFVAGGLVGMITAARIPYRIWSARQGLFAKILMATAAVLAVAVLIPGIGVEVNGARRWLQLGPQSMGIRFQPSEMMKISLPIFLASWMAVCCDIRRFRRGFLPTVALVGLCVAAVGIEDFGTAALIAAVSGAMLLFAGIRWWHTLLVTLPGVAGFALLLIQSPNRVARITTFLDIWKEPEGSGYQVIQSLCTIASGGWAGQGLGQGFVKGYLPEARNDFIFAVICEELGMIGACAVIALLIALMWQGRKTMLMTRDPMGRLLAFGIILTLGLQAAMNIAVVTVSVPTKGISLPLVSAGGSGAIFLGALTGVLANIARTGPLHSPNPRESGEKRG
jgi:cell division protein FtsW